MLVIVSPNARGLITMKHVQVIDAALNCSYSICAVDDDDFSVIFPAPGQDVEFVEDIIGRLGKRRTGQLGPVSKQ